MNKEDLVATALLFWDGSGSEVVFRLDDDADELLDVLLLSTWCWCVSTSVECPLKNYAGCGCEQDQKEAQVDNN